MKTWDIDWTKSKFGNSGNSSEIEYNGKVYVTAIHGNSNIENNKIAFSRDLLNWEIVDPFSKFSSSGLIYNDLLVLNGEFVLLTSMGVFAYSENGSDWSIGKIKELGEQDPDFDRNLNGMVWDGTQ